MSIHVNQFVRPQFQGCVEKNEQLNEKISYITTELEKMSKLQAEMNEKMKDTSNEMQNFVKVAQFNDLVLNLNETMMDLESSLNSLVNSTPRDLKNLNVKIEELQNEISNIKNLQDIVLNEDKQSTVNSQENPIPRTIPKIRITKQAPK